MRKMITEGASAREVADALGTSKNAVIGKVHRTPGLKIAHRKKGERKPRKKYDQSNAAIAARKGLLTVEPVPIVVPDEAPPSQALHILELREDTCRWPYGTRNGYSFCGEVAVPGKPYCPWHHTKAFNKVLTKFYNERHAEREYNKYER